MNGRTSWYPCDAAEADRELNVELGDEFGPGGPLVMRVMKDLAGQQDLRGEGQVRTGFRVLAKKCHIERDRCREIIERAAEIGALDDLRIDDDGRRFTCRVSGWKADFNRGKSTLKKGDQRANQGEDDPPPEGDVSPPEEDNSSPEDGDVSPAERDTSPKLASTGHDTTVDEDDDDRAGAPEPTPLKHPKLDEALACMAEVDGLAANDAAVNAALRRADREGRDVLAVVDKAVSLAHRYLAEGRLRTDASGLIYSVLDHDVSTSVGELAAASSSARAAAAGRRSEPPRDPSFDHLGRTSA